MTCGIGRPAALASAIASRIAGWSLPKFAKMCDTLHAWRASRSAWLDVYIRRTIIRFSLVSTASSGSTVDVGRLLDEGPWTGFQQWLVGLTALTIIFDGADNQLLGASLPMIMRDWGLAKAAFSPVLAAGFVGMLIGGAVAGVFGDRIGRKKALIASVVVFGLATSAIATAADVTMLGVLRFIAGLGLGGAVPNAAALASEFVPKRHRPIAVTLTIVCVPLGGTLAGLLAIRVLPVFGWRTLFLFGGAEIGRAHV